MPAFTVYNEAGEILRWGECPEQDLEHQLFNPGEQLYPGEALTAHTHRFRGGKPVGKSAAELKHQENERRKK